MSFFDGAGGWLAWGIFSDGLRHNIRMPANTHLRTKAPATSSNPNSSLLGRRHLVCNSLDGGSVHSRNRRPVDHGFQHQSCPRREADTEIFPGRASRSGVRGTGTDSYDDGQDGCENSKTAHRSILWRTIRRLCHGSSSKLSEVNKSTQRAKWDEPQPARNQQIHRAFKNRNVRFRADLFRSGQAGWSGWMAGQVLIRVPHIPQRCGRFPGCRTHRKVASSPSSERNLPTPTFQNEKLEANLAEYYRPNC